MDGDICVLHVVKFLVVKFGRLVPSVGFMVH